MQWIIGHTHPILSEMAYKTIHLVCILHSDSKYVGEFVVEDLHTREVLSFVGEQTEWKDTKPVLIHTGNLTMPWKEMIVSKDDAETWKYYEYPKN